MSLATTGRHEPAGTPAMPDDFAQALFARTAAEDLGRLPASAQDALAHEAWRHLLHRDGTGADIRTADLPTALTAGRPTTLIEIINDDRPFLLDSAVGEITARGFDIRLIAHPMLAVSRDADGNLTACHGAAGPDAPAAGARRESLIHIHVAMRDRAEDIRALADGLREVFADVAAATGDWTAMRARLRAATAGLAGAPPPLPAAEVAEAAAFLTWLEADNFTLLGMRDYAHREDGAGERLEPIDGTGLGILRDPDLRILRRGNEMAVFTPEIAEFLHRPVPLIVAKANVKTRVHRRAYLDYIGLKLFDADGRLSGETRIVGLFGSATYTRPLDEIPLLRAKAAAVTARSGLSPDSSSGRALAHVLEAYPRDELFQLDAEALFGFAMETAALYERPRIRVLPRVDRFDRFVSLMVFVPRERYDSTLRQRIGEHLAEVYDGHVSAYYPAFPEGVPLTRVHFIIGRREGPTPQVDRADLEAGIAALVETWPDRLRAVLAGRHDAATARRLARRYADAFSLGYQEAFSAADAADDIGRLERLSTERPLAIDFERDAADRPARVTLKLLSAARELPLAERVPLLDNMGFRAIEERTFALNPGTKNDRATVWLHDLVLETKSGRAVDIADLGERLEELFLAVVQGRADSDGINALVLEAGLHWRDAQVVQAISRYLRQALIPFGQGYMAGVVTRHADIAAAIVALFHLRFDPAGFADAAARQQAVDAAIAAIEADLQAVESLDEDRILRRFLNVVQAMVRTNFYQREPDGGLRAAFSFKLMSREVDGLPEPRPLYEVFVYSPRLEGIHLRFGKVARGGIRWSDRPQDFRTEILGLVKAQQVKNAVIVPVGAKGGFVPMKLPAGPREAVFAEGTAAYRIFISALLDITDDLDGDTVVPPQGTVRVEGDDPYLVVAADKGTATFSDTANAIAAEHGYWLDDAFASGGSEGYDHKVMGITARGAWESVKRHFRERGRDIQAEPFTVAGVGDMSGDVFGNGMLQSEEIRLVAAFDHRHIFIDPDPDPAKSFTERARLFALPRSSWEDYDVSCLSKGGGIYPRSLKAAALSAEARALLGITAAQPTPQAIIAAVLKLDVDLLWFGGIGTYIRASTESDAEVGDRANDAVRIAGAEVRATVIGEGANLGVTQRGRIEAALKGVALNTDAIDNSAGVNTSDMEVNIKIALAGPLRAGTLAREDRNELLQRMTGEVAALVLRNNYEQTLALSLAERRGLEDLGFEGRLMQELETRGLLNRAVEFLPDDAAMVRRAAAGSPLTRPELSVLLAYAKSTLFDDLLDSAVPDDPYLDGELTGYFPAPMRTGFADAIAGHRLRREIIATRLANAMVNAGGPSLIVRMTDQTGADVAAIAAAFLAVRAAFRLPELETELDALDGRIAGEVQLHLYAQVQDLLLSRMVWFLRQVDLAAGPAAIALRFAGAIAAVQDGLEKALGADAQADWHAAQQDLIDQGVPSAAARWLASLPALRAAPDAVLVAETGGTTLEEAAATLFAVADGLRLDALRAKAAELAITDYYERLALDRALGEIDSAERALAAAAGGGRTGVERWLAGHAQAGRVGETIDHILAAGVSLPKLSVAAGLLRDLAGR